MRCIGEAVARRCSLGEWEVVENRPGCSGGCRWGRRQYFGGDVLERESAVFVGEFQGLSAPVIWGGWCLWWRIGPFSFVGR